MSDDTDILLMKIERQVGRICRALEDKGNDDANEQYLREHILDFLKRNFPEYRDAGAAREYFERVLGDHDAMTIAVDSDSFTGESVRVPTGVARSLFIIGWMAAMKSVRGKVQS